MSSFQYSETEQMVCLDDPYVPFKDLYQELVAEPSICKANSIQYDYLATFEGKEDKIEFTTFQPTHQIEENRQQNQFIQFQFSNQENKHHLKRKCVCKKSHCSKKYCQCFKAGLLCLPECECVDCENDIHHFTQPLKSPKSGKGCNCKKSRCQKKYCECFNHGLKCTDQCSCYSCSNCQAKTDEELSSSTGRKAIKKN